MIYPAQSFLMYNVRVDLSSCLIHGSCLRSRNFWSTSTHCNGVPSSHQVGRKQRLESLRLELSENGAVEEAMIQSAVTLLNVKSYVEL